MELTKFLLSSRSQWLPSSSSRSTSRTSTAPLKRRTRLWSSSRPISWARPRSSTRPRSRRRTNRNCCSAFALGWFGLSRGMNLEYETRVQEVQRGSPVDLVDQPRPQHRRCHPDGLRQDPQSVRMVWCRYISKGAKDHLKQQDLHKHSRGSRLTYLFLDQRLWHL